MVNHTKITKNAGIYKFTCFENEKVYIGKSINIYNRVKQHKTCKGDGYFQRAILKYGWESFELEILEVVENFDKLKDNESLLQRESYYINLFDSTNPKLGYNICKYSTDRTGIPLSEETKKKMSSSQTGRKHSDASKRNMRKSQLGKKQSDATKEKRKLYVHSPEVKEKIRNYRIGKKHSDETKEKIRQARLANPPSEDQMEKLRQSNIGRKHTEEHIEKRRQANLGKKRSDEYKRKMSELKLTILTNQNQ